TYGYFTDPINPTCFNQIVSINQDGQINTLGGIYCEGNLSAPNIYTIAQVDTALSLKANQSTTYTNTEVQQLFLSLIDNAPASLDTLNELANALANDANYATTI
ncbi:MAG: hypothetical protein ACKPKO_14680, partial [Candidatus Fonsibacter sp.]